MLFSLGGIRGFFFFQFLVFSFSYSISATMDEMEADENSLSAALVSFGRFRFRARKFLSSFGNFLSFACRRDITRHREHVLW